jgi:hypothetical protein
MRQQFLVDAIGTFKTYIYEFDRKIVPTSATLTVFNPGTSTELIDAQVMDVAGDGLLSYDLTTTHNDIADENYKAVISYVVNTLTFSTTLFYDVVNSVLHKVITDRDIVSELPQLKDNGWMVHGTSKSGSTTTIIDDDLEKYLDDYFTGGLAYSIDQDETREITDFVSSTGTVTTNDFPASAETDKYVLTRSFTDEIQRAFEKIEDRLRQKGQRAHLILDPYDIREVHINQTVADVCKGLANDEQAIWWGFWQEYEKKVNQWWKNATFKYDVSDDGVISGEEEKYNLKNLKAGRR